MTSSASRRALLVGLAAMAAYLIAAAATLGGGVHVRPLYDGFAPPPPYQWVNPPKEFATGAVKPVPVTEDVPLGATGNDTRGIATQDGQFVLNLPTGAIPPHDGDTSVKAVVTPVDPGTLGPLPESLRPDGNAYQVTMTYQPSGQPVGRLATPGNVVMTVPNASEDVLYSPDGRAWSHLTTQNLAGPTTPSTTLDQPGYYLGATPPTSTDTSGGGGSSGSGDRVVAIAVITVAVAAGLWFIPALLRRRRNRSRPKKRDKR